PREAGARRPAADSGDGLAPARQAPATSAIRSRGDQAASQLSRRVARTARTSAPRRGRRAAAESRLPAIGTGRDLLPDTAGRAGEQAATAPAAPTTIARTGKAGCPPIAGRAGAM